MLKKLPGLITSSETVSHIGKIENIVGMAMEASGGAGSIGDIVMIYNEDLKETGSGRGGRLSRRYASADGL